jgi:hypothetical protein
LTDVPMVYESPSATYRTWSGVGASLGSGIAGVVARSGVVRAVGPPTDGPVVRDGMAALAQPTAARLTSERKTVTCFKTWLTRALSITALSTTVVRPTGPADAPADGPGSHAGRALLSPALSSAPGGPTARLSTHVL